MVCLWSVCAVDISCCFVFGRRACVYSSGVPCVRENAWLLEEKKLDFI